MNLVRFLPFSLIMVLASAQPAPPAPDLARNPAAVESPLNPALPTLWIAGDSTAARGAGAAQQGWAVPFADYFDPSKVNVANRAGAAAAAPSSPRDCGPSCLRRLSPATWF